MESFDDMALARETADTGGYHQRSPSMMIVVPLQDGDETLYCDDLNASFFDPFQDEKDNRTGTYQDPTHMSRLELVSPRGVVDEAVTVAYNPLVKLLSAQNDAGVIPNITDLIQSTSISAARRSCHRRSRNRALGTAEFARSVLPHLEEAQVEHDAAKDEKPSPLLNDRIEEAVVLPFNKKTSECLEF